MARIGLATAQSLHDEFAAKTDFDGLPRGTPAAMPDEAGDVMNAAQPAEAATMTSEARRPSASRRLDVIVAEDDPPTRNAVAKAVRTLGHACRAAPNGVDALRLHGEHPADVIISDWDMPGISGVELCRRTRVVDDESPYVYFILMTGYGDRAHLLEGMEAGADDYQKKPIDLDELEARLVSAARVVALQRRLADRTAGLRHDSRRFYVASRTDGLTGAGNRLRLDEDLEAMSARAQRYGHSHAIAMCDIDHFKAFNDRFGHLAGDEALRRVSDSIRANLRSGDALYRYGGEELVILLPEQSLDAAATAMERVRAAVETLAIPSGLGDGALTMSIGIARLEGGHEVAPVEWLDRADEALYRAKRGGRNRVER